jgi:hypothetical protein
MICKSQKCTHKLLRSLRARICSLALLVLRASLAPIKGEFLIKWQKGGGGAPMYAWRYTAYTRVLKKN